MLGVDADQELRASFDFVAFPRNLMLRTSLLVADVSRFLIDLQMVQTGASGL